MAISKEIINVYISLSKSDGKEVVNAYSVSGSRKKELFSRLHHAATAGYRGIRISCMELNQITSDNEKTAREFLKVLFQANASDYIGICCTLSSGPKHTFAVQQLLLACLPLLKDREVRFWCDPQNIKVSQLKSYVQKTGIAGTCQSESFEDSTGLQTSRFLGDLFLSTRLPAVRKQLETQLRFEKRFFIRNGDLLYLQSNVSEEMYRQLLPLSEKIPVSAVDGWLKKGMVPSDTVRIRRLLDKGIHPDDLAGYSLNKIRRLADQQDEEQNSTQQTAVPAENTRMAEAWETYAKNLQHACRSRQEQNGQILQARARRLLDRHSQLRSRLDIWIREEDEKLYAMITPVSRKLQASMPNPCQEDYKIYAFEGKDPSARIHTFLSWLVILQGPFFIHCAPEIQSELRLQLLKLNSMIPCVSGTVQFPRTKGSLRWPAAARPQATAWFPQNVAARLEEDHYQVLTSSDFSPALIRNMALAFTRGLPSERIMPYCHAADLFEVQVQIREMVSRYIHPSHTRKTLHTFLEKTGDLAAYDFLASTGLSSSKREYLMEQLFQGTSLNVMRWNIHTSMSLNAMKDALRAPDVPFEHRTEAEPFVQMPDVVKEDIKSMALERLQKDNRSRKPNRQKNNVLRADEIAEILENQYF